MKQQKTTELSIMTYIEINCFGIFDNETTSHQRIEFK